MNINQLFEMYLNKRVYLTRLKCGLNVDCLQHTENSHDYAVYLLAHGGVIWVYSMSSVYFRRGPEKPMYYYWPDIQSVLCLSSTSAGLELWLSTSSLCLPPETWPPTESPSVLHQAASQTLNGSLSTQNTTQTQAGSLLFYYHQFDMYFVCCPSCSCSSALFP